MNAINDTTLPDANGNYDLSVLLPPLGEAVVLWDSWGVPFIGQRLESVASLGETWEWTVSPSQDMITLDQAEFTHWAWLKPPVTEATNTVVIGYR